MAYSLQYFKADYKAINATGITQAYNYATDLFNGNISAMATALMQANGSPLAWQVKAFRYDQLNRFKNMQTASGISSALSNNFASAYIYDFNGNILSLQRYNATGANMHTIAYTYPIVQNRLNSISVTGSGINNSSYTYDKLGNLAKDAGENINIQWNLADKVTKAGTPTNTSAFSYSAMGQRQVKEISPLNATYYIHDAQGNVLCMYAKTYNPQHVIPYGLKVSEQYIYGSSRLGVYNRNLSVKPSDEDAQAFTRGQKYYELNNHLGNVNSVISDRKIQVSSGVYRADIKSYVDYYPFGYQIAARTWQQENYRYGFNGQEKDDEILGAGNHLDFEFRGYDSRLGRFWSVDPLTKSYPYWTPYQFAGNMPIRFLELEGLEPGEPFNSKVDAATDFLLLFNDNSIRDNKEYLVQIYEYHDNKQTKYSYTIPSVGGASNAKEPNSIPNNATVVARAHTHSASTVNAPAGQRYQDENFSGDRNSQGIINTPAQNLLEKTGDLGIYNKNKVTGYVGTPGGKFLEYDETTGVINTISTIIPKDAGTGTGQPGAGVSPQSTSVYTIKKGDTLYSISKRYMTTVSSIMQENNLSDKDVGTLQVGKTLNVTN